MCLAQGLEPTHKLQDYWLAFYQDCSATSPSLLILQLSIGYKTEECINTIVKLSLNPHQISPMNIKFSSLWAEFSSLWPDLSLDTDYVHRKQQNQELLDMSWVQYYNNSMDFYSNKTKNNNFWVQLSAQPDLYRYPWVRNHAKILWF
jgi:hypothetical protein